MSNNRAVSWGEKDWRKDDNEIQIKNTIQTENNFYRQFVKISPKFSRRGGNILAQQWPTKGEEDTEEELDEEEEGSLFGTSIARFREMTIKNIRPKSANSQQACLTSSLFVPQFLLEARVFSTNKKE